MRRVLVTGSRLWFEIDEVFDALQKEFHEYGQFVLVHGAAKDGVDNFAHQWYKLLGEDQGCVEEPHAADWKPWGRGGRTDMSAGLKRNSYMVQSGADVCLAFPIICKINKPRCLKTAHYTHGTLDCMTKANKAGIMVINYGPSLN